MEDPFAATQSARMTSLAACAAPALVIVYLLYRSLQPQPLPGIPIAFPKGYTSVPWFSGFAFELARRLKSGDPPTRVFWELGQGRAIYQFINGPAGTWLARWTGFGQYIVCCTDIEEYETACVRHSAVFAKGAQDTDFFAFGTPRGMLALTSPADHRHHRRVVTPSMSNAFLAKVVPRIERTFEQLVALWQARIKVAHRRGENIFDAAEDLRLAAMSVGTSLGLGESFDSLVQATEFIRETPDLRSASLSPAPSRFLQSASIVLHQASACAFLGPIGRYYNWYCAHIRSETKYARAYLQRFAQEWIAGERLTRLQRRQLEETSSEDTAEKSKSANADHVLGVLVDGEETDRAKGNAPLPDVDMIDELITFILAGTDTIVTALSWTVKLLSRHPEVQQRLHHELVANVGAVLDYETLQHEEQLPYLHAVVWECLRLARTVDMVGRTPTRDTMMGGYILPKGVHVAFIIGHMDGSVESRQAHGAKKGRAGRENDDDALFRPERWLKRDQKGGEFFDRTARHFPAFGAGPRGCFGKPLALLQLKIAIIKFVGAFHFDSVPKELDSDKVEEILVRRPVHVMLRLTPRN